MFYEARCEAMMLSNPKNCMFDGATCYQHHPSRMLQIFSLKLAKIQVAEGGPVELYGYVAARDILDPLLNYVVNFNRDDPILVEQVHTHTYLQLFYIIVCSSHYNWQTFHFRRTSEISLNLGYIVNVVPVLLLIYLIDVG